MVYKDSIKGLLKEGLLKQCPIDYRAVSNLIKRAQTDLKTARRNLDLDSECSYNYAYNAIMRCGLALMFVNGYRPEIKDKHLTVVRYLNAILSDEYKRTINDYDFMRKKRNRLIYEPDIPCSSKEAKDALRIAQNFVEKIYKIIKQNNPQKEFDF